MSDDTYKGLFWLLGFMVCVALIADLESGVDTIRHVWRVLIAGFVLVGVAVVVIGYAALVFVFVMDNRRHRAMTKQELENEYLRRVAGVDRLSKRGLL